MNKKELKKLLKEQMEAIKPIIELTNDLSQNLYNVYMDFCDDDSEEMHETFKEVYENFMRKLDEKYKIYLDLDRKKGKINMEKNDDPKCMGRFKLIEITDEIREKEKIDQNCNIQYILVPEEKQYENGLKK